MLSSQVALIREAATELRHQVPAPEPSRVLTDLDWAFRNSVKMRAVKRIVDHVAETDATVLIWGESGVGKEIVARTLHALSPRHAAPLVKVNCAALPIELLESELFGHERGAFTGAHQQKPGKFELAHLGTIFLDEIGEMPLPIQAKLLQVLQDRQFARLGSRHDIRVDVRVVAATNKNLHAMVRGGTFRQDLFYRLNVVDVHVPPLRERREEIAPLLDYYITRHARTYERPVPTLSADLLRDLLDYDWPGNVRELENLTMRLVVLGTDAFVAEEVAPARAAPPPAPAVRAEPAAADPYAGRGLRDIAREAAREAERVALMATLERVRWHRLEAARRLRVGYKTLLTKMKEHNLDVAR
jgi:two-component system response regulator AtoC